MGDLPVRLYRAHWFVCFGSDWGQDGGNLQFGGTTLATYQQAYSYDALDRLTSGPSGTETYGFAPVHGALTLGTVPGQYASYDAMGNMTCRNVDTTTAHACDGSQTGAQMTYDNEGHLETWTAPSGTMASDQYLYDNSGQRVFQHSSATLAGTTTKTDTITFDGYTDVTTTDGVTSTTKYYSVGGQRVAMKKDGVLSYLLPDMLGSTSIALKDDGSVQAVQLFAPFGGTRYSDGSMATPYNYTGQRLDSTSGLLYYNARYYDATSGRFTSADTVETNLEGHDPFAYVRGNPEISIDPTGHRPIPVSELDSYNVVDAAQAAADAAQTAFEEQAAIDRSALNLLATTEASETLLGPGVLAGMLFGLSIYMIWYNSTHDISQQTPPSYSDGIRPTPAPTPVSNNPDYHPTPTPEPSTSASGAGSGRGNCTNIDTSLKDSNGSHPEDHITYSEKEKKERFSL